MLVEPSKSPNNRLIVTVGLLLTSIMASATNAQPLGSKELPYDVVVYGGTSAGIAAAVQVKRMKRSVIVIEPTRRIGGLTTGGLGQTDIGNKAAIGGISREFYQRVRSYYKDASHWQWQKRDEYRSGGQSRTGDKEDTMWTFEPSAALSIMQDFVRAYEIPVAYEERLDRTPLTEGQPRVNGVSLDGTRIIAITAESGKTYHGRTFIDATYEGDLLAGAGVSYAVGRESNTAYDETLNGVQTRRAIHHQFVRGVDPYVIPGEPNSGLLPGIDPTGPGKEGEADHRVQAFCFRMCLTDHPDNRIPFAKPAGYDPLQYELLFRNFDAGAKVLPWSFSPMPNRKTDINNNRGFSTDYIGQSYDYPDASYAERERIIERHRTYQQGLMWTLANHPRVPAAMRETVSRWGTCRDEFERADGWQQQLYIREARRMVGSYVMTQHNCQGRVTAERPVGLAAYTMDSHNVQRHVDANGQVRNEGDVQVGGFSPYPIDYGSLAPKRDECTNLLVPVCLSASHIAFGSIRMEPVFMVLGQSAATAAVQSIEDKVAVQDVSYERLQERLVADKQTLVWTGPKRVAAIGLDPKKLKGIVMDDADAERVGFDSVSTSVGPFVGIGYRHDGNAGKGDQTIRFRVKIEKPGQYDVRIAWTPHSNRATNVPVKIYHAGLGAKTVFKNQRRKPKHEPFEWIGSFPFRGEAVIEISNADTDGYVIVDAVQLLPAKRDKKREDESSSWFQLKQNDVVAFLGGTNMLHLQQAGYLEAMLSREFAAARPRFRDLSWEADTVFRQGTILERWREDGHGDLEGLGNLAQQLARVDTTVVIAQFGQLESLAGKSGVADFARAYDRLIDTLSQHGRKVILVTPTPFEQPPSALIPDLSQRNADLALYIVATSKLAKRRNLPLIDLFSNMKPDLTENGMHIKPEAQAYVAQQIAKQLGVSNDVTDIEQLRQAIIEKHRLWYDYWRPANWKLLFGDDWRRQFTVGGKDYIPFREEWQKLIPLIDAAHERVWQIAAGGKDPGDNRTKPEVLHGDPRADIEAELAAFTASDGLKVNLFASEEHGLTSPLNLRWDPAGRMYVTVTTTYPHVFPGDLPNDKIIMLEDTDDDGRADRSTVFADGLNIPTGLEWGDGGIYVGQNTQILFLKDTDGDGEADERRVVLSGFGNGDSHQTINSFIWSPDGELYFGHGDGCESRIETPWGASNLFNAGFYRFRPQRLRLLPFLEGHMGPGNPWGTAFDEWGQIINVDGAGGVNWLTPGLVSTTHRRKFPRIGDPGGYCGIGYLDGRHLPESLHGDFVVGDFKSNRVKRFSLESSGAGFDLQWREPLLQSRHRNFRPVDVKVGPDGAIYVVDWYNPITCHQDDAYRHPDRDKAHGRIWRLSADSAATTPSDLLDASIEDVLDALASPEHFTRYQAKRALTTRGRDEVATALDEWVRALNPMLPRYEHHLYEALGAYATIEVVEPNLLQRLLRAADPRARAFATRIVGRWHDRLDDPLALLAESVADDHPLVRLEAVIACSAVPSAQSIEVAAHVVDQPEDSWIDYAFGQTVHQLAPHWLPAFRRGDVSFERPNQLAAVLNEVGGRGVIEDLKQLVDEDKLEPELRASAINAILAVGNGKDLRTYGLESGAFTRSGRYDAAAHAAALGQLIETAQYRDERPAGDLAAALGELLENPHPQLQAHALTLAGLWRVSGLTDDVISQARDASLAIPVRAAAFAAITQLQPSVGQELLAKYVGGPHDSRLRAAAIQTLASVDTPAAAGHAAALLSEGELSDEVTAETLAAFLNRTEGAQALAAALNAHDLQPATARRLLRSVFASGRSDQMLLAALNRAIGAAGQAPDYSVDYVHRLAFEAKTKGNATAGEALFRSLACNSCHKVGGAGGSVGPNLAAIGTTLSGERIVEELLWPNRQVKEGFSMVQLITDDGKIHQGYERPTRSEQDTVALHDPATNKEVSIAADRIEERKITGSVMPAGLTAILSREQLLDLVSYLTELGKIE